MKKLVAIVLVALALCTLGCNGDPKPTSPVPTHTPMPTAPGNK